ncbi:hypothetical protein LSUE1_G009155 [Lachnellula suecica]|uniref:SH3 domain-containing protein n=1 Tax=Lachnellula suecica TaxID=602035 RepID=A0A8T9C776_9HELO|nr:hypothetical protein LSUE1_G009155 [Lachnellula suecica]
MVDHAHLHRRHVARAPIPEPIAEALPAPVQTLVSVVYVTASPTFDGPIGGYTTVGVDSDPTTAAAAPAAQPTTAPTTAAQPKSSAPASQAKSAAVAPGIEDNSALVASKSSSDISSIIAQTNSGLSSSTGLPTAISSPTLKLTSSIPILAATSALSAEGTSTKAASAASATSSSSTSSSDSGMSAGGKAGLAIGILLLVGAILALVLFCFRKRKDQHKELADHEKQDPFADSLARPASTHTTRTNPNAPRLSLRPVTQFLPNLGEKRQSRGNALTTAAAVPMSEKARPMTPQDNNRANPFGNHAESIDPANANGPAEVRVMSPTGEIVTAATGAAAGAAAVGLARGASKRENGPKPLNFTNTNPFMGPPSPSGTEFSVSSESTESPPQQTITGAAIAAAGGPANSTVHRVQLDFKPSMEDELELRAGQLIRLLHEYDDGWALCIRLDRTQQGVVPRTCLSTRPVKPRPQGPQGPPGARGTPPPGMRLPVQGRPMSPANHQGRPMSPAMNPGAPRSGPPRSMSPASQRPRTPNGAGPRGPPNNQQGRPRSPSAAQTQARRNSPPGPSPMNPMAQSDSPPELARKPVPGQAL